MRAPYVREAEVRAARGMNARAEQQRTVACGMAGVCAQCGSARRLGGLARLRWCGRETAGRAVVEVVHTHGVRSRDNVRARVAREGVRCGLV